jgi:hypothetical protein
MTRLAHALQRTRHNRRGCSRCVPCAGSLSLGLGITSRTNSMPILFAIAAFFLNVLPLLANGMNVPGTPPSGGDDFDPGLLLFVVVMLAACALLVGAGLVGGVVAFVLAGALTTFGIISSSEPVLKVDGGELRSSIDGIRRE